MRAAGRERIIIESSRGRGIRPLINLQHTVHRCCSVLQRAPGSASRGPHHPVPTHPLTSRASAVSSSSPTRERFCSVTRWWCTWPTAIRLLTATRSRPAGQRGAGQCNRLERLGSGWGGAWGIHAPQPQQRSCHPWRAGSRQPCCLPCPSSAATRAPVAATTAATEHTRVAVAEHHKVEAVVDGLRSLLGHTLQRLHQAAGALGDGPGAVHDLRGRQGGAGSRNGPAAWMWNSVQTG